MNKVFKAVFIISFFVLTSISVVNASNNVKCSSIVYGKSEMGRDLVCYSISEDSYDNTILLNFAIHGFEDEYDNDSYVLTNAANELIEYYKNAEELHGTRLLIVPCANPDGQIDGTTNYGFGRCNSKGIDLNRDFDANYISYSTARNYTQYPFSASESRALRDLCLQYDPYIVIDFHGWENCTIGDYEIGSVFYDKMGLARSHAFTDTNSRGYFSNWAHQQGAYGLLVEFTNSSSVDMTKLKAAVDRLVEGDFDNGGGRYEVDPQYGKYTDIIAYPPKTGRITTYADINVPYTSTSYIDGGIDKCTIKKIYKNGWIRTEYPTSSGEKPGFVHLSDFLTNLVTPYKVTVDSNTTVYTLEDMSTSIGTAFTTDEIYVLGENTDGSKVQVIYPLDTGGYKLGWLYASEVNTVTDDIEADKGDVNGDGAVDFADAVIILQADVEKVNLSDIQKKLADVNDDGVVDFADAVMVLRMDVGL